MAGVRVARIIGRLNIGGPATQAITLTKLLEPEGYETLLIRGSEASHEGSMDDLAAEWAVRPLLIGHMRRELNPGDARALPQLIRALRRFDPHIVHTHAAKAGALGRTAALLARPTRPPIVVHTYHGHSLEGYFSPAKAAVFRGIETALARRTDRLVAVSPEVRDDLVRLGVAPAEKLTVIPLGFDLARFDPAAQERERRRLELRAALGIPRSATLVTLVARLVPIKRVDRFLRIAARVAAESDAHFLIVGDGELSEELRATALPPALERRLTWAGFRRDIPDVCFASDLVVLTSDNEGTPVSLIEAQAAGLPVVSTNVGGAAAVVRDGESGHLLPSDDEEGFARAILAVNADRGLAERMGAAGRAHVTSSFALPRLVDDVVMLYTDLIRERSPSS